MKAPKSRYKAVDHELWEYFKKHVTPLPKAKKNFIAPLNLAHKAEKSRKAEPNKAEPNLLTKPLPTKLIKHSLVKPQKQTAVSESFLFDRKLYRQLHRGQHRMCAQLDLHDHTQEKAYQRLLRFCHEAWGAQLSVVLVITGKGGAAFGERGVLKRLLPHWLASKDFQPFIHSVSLASARHGGEGAYYIKLKKKAAIQNKQ